MDLAKLVTTREPYQWRQGPHWPDRKTVFAKRRARFHIVALDYGIKRNILRLLTDCDARITVMPASSTAEAVMAEMPDGVFLSNGPGDPEPCAYAIETIGALLELGVPIFGICLGHQLLALASGARTEKMKFGHHGANHPVVDLDSGRVMITSQNHGFAVAEDSLPDNLRPTHRSLFDGTLQGIERTDVPAFSFQGHPEASPGPHDVAPLFARFVRDMASQKS
jgi:carbamoyl-phosphate synthase small subunit